MEYLNFQNIYGNNEDAYSKIIAQTFMISDNFRKGLIELINTKHNDKKIADLSTADLCRVSLENSFGPLGRLDILFELQNGLNIGIENKKWAALQEHQLKRYKSAFEAIGQPYILIFLSPKNYSLGEGDRPQNLNKGVFVQINYGEIFSICQQILSESSTDFEINYLTSLQNFLEGVTLMPLNNLEIDSLKFYYTAKNKILNILKEVNKNKEYIEDTANYLLSSRNINSNLCFYGFRFGTGWYYNDALLNNNAEIIFYIKDVEANIEEAKRKNLMLEQFYVKNMDKMESMFGGSIDYYVRKRKNECRLAIRRSLLDFEGKEIEEPIKWLSQVIQYMETALPEK